MTRRHLGWIPHGLLGVFGAFRTVPYVTRKRTTKAHGQKHQFDKAHTKSSVAASRLKLLGLSSCARIIEPSAGGGAFCDHLLADPSLPVLAFDLAPENAQVIRQDWFDYDTVTPAATHIVGNPPFAQQCALALRFINHALRWWGRRRSRSSCRGITGGRRGCGLGSGSMIARNREISKEIPKNCPK